MHPAALEITSPLGVRPCRMAMASSATPQERRQLQTARWKTIADIASPMKRRDPGLPLVTCLGFSPPTFLHQGLALRASIPAITEAIRPGVAGPLSWSCGWHDRRKRQGTGVITDDGRSSDPSVSHQAPYRASRGRAGLCLRSPIDSREPPNSRACRTRSRRGWQSRRHAGVGGRDEPPVMSRVLRRRPLPS